MGVYVFSGRRSCMAFTGIPVGLVSRCACAVLLRLRVQRQRQIDIGKATLGYAQYTARVPKCVVRVQHTCHPCCVDVFNNPTPRWP